MSPLSSIASTHQFTHTALTCLEAKHVDENYLHPEEFNPSRPRRNKRTPTRSTWVSFRTHSTLCSPPQVLEYEAN